MQLKSISLANFRTYKRHTFIFSPLTIIVGQNTIGKTNILEAIYMLTTGTSFRAEKDVDTIHFDSNFARIDALLEDNNNSVKMTVQLLNDSAMFHKRYLVNEVGKRLNDFVSYFSSVIFSPTDLVIISESPNLRRKHIDTVLSTTSSSYRLALSLYTKALKQRNKLLGLIKSDKRSYSVDEFSYWNSLLIEHATTITKYREEYVEYVNTAHHTAFPLQVTYDKSLFTQERLEKYREAELSSGITLIGPQRDDFIFSFKNTGRLIREFASRGEQRLTVLQLKLLEIEYIEKITGEKPVLLLDDIFSELDSRNIEHIAHLLSHQQSIITTTHIEYIPDEILKKAKIIRLPEDLKS
jgi:DNA replication and repair protein RecF